MHDVVIIGAGVIGAAIARELCRHKLDVVLLEKHPDVAMGATKGNSAIVHGGFAESHSKLKGRLCYRGRSRFAALSEELHFPFKPIGSFVFAFEEGQRAGLESLLENGKKNGVTDLSILGHDEIVEMEPNINPEVKYGLWCEGAGVCSPFEYCIAMTENAIANGLELKLSAEVSAIAKKGDGFEVATAGGDVLASRFVVNAAGLQSGDVSAMVGVDDFTIHPRSGEYIIMGKGTDLPVNSVLFQMPTKMGKGILVAPTVYGNLLIGPDAIDERRDDRGTHVERLYRIYREATLTTPSLDMNKFLRSFAGVRAVSSTDDFVIEATRVPGFVNVAGIQSPGMTSSPAVGDLVRDILAESGLKLEKKKDFNPERRAPHAGRKVSPKELQDLVKLPVGADGRMICRCEQVEEAAVRDLLDRGIPITTRDAVKRRTQAGMGFCQGAFCGPRIAELMAGLGVDGFDARTDVERDGLKRVGREEMLAFLKAQVDNT